MLRPYQSDLIARIHAAWTEAPNVIATAPTGAGKTKIFCEIIQALAVPTVVIAHRGELVSQVALALNRERVPHSIVGPKPLIQQVIALEHETHGHSCFAWRSETRVASVDTLIRRETPERWEAGVRLVVCDEAHHVAPATNKWGRAILRYPQARVLGVTAHAERGDRLGLGRHADGVFDRLVVGPSCRDLIDAGWLAEYRIFCPPNDLDFSDVPIGSTGDYSAPRLRTATHKSAHLVGDVVKHYQQLAGGKLGVTFAVDVESANEICVAYRKAGVPAEVITGATPIAARGQIMRQFRARKLLQLVSVDVLGEGVDVPEIEVVSLARRTASFQVFSQQIGRALRVSASGERKIILDHVGNTAFHGLPDAPRAYTLDRRESRARTPAPDVIPLRVCLACFQPYERYRGACPHCGAGIPPPVGRGSPEQVDGDLRELDPAVLAALRGEVARVDAPVRLPAQCEPLVARAITKRHHERAAAQRELRARMALWAGWYRHTGLTDSEIQRLFWHTFAVDPLTASAVGAQTAAELQARIDAQIQRLNIIEETTP